MAADAEQPVRVSRRIVLALAGIGLAIVLVGGYDGGWSWTGFAHHATLWDWLHLLALPLAFTVIPLWAGHRDELDRRRKQLLILAGTAFVALVVLGYALDLGWTGFPGNRLWDWLELLVLPLAIGLVPVWNELSKEFRLRHALGLGCLLAAFAVAIVGGYALGWRWTGFHGNTLYDWLDLFVAPVLLPLVVIPLTREWLDLEGNEPEPGTEAPPPPRTAALPAEEPVAERLDAS